MKSNGNCHYSVDDDDEEEEGQHNTTLWRTEILPRVSSQRFIKYVLCAWWCGRGAFVTWKNVFALYFFPWHFSLDSYLSLSISPRPSSAGISSEAGKCLHSDPSINCNQLVYRSISQQPPPSSVSTESSKFIFDVLHVATSVSVIIK